MAKSLERDATSAARLAELRRAGSPQLQSSGDGKNAPDLDLVAPDEEPVFARQLARNPADAARA